MPIKSSIEELLSGLRRFKDGDSSIRFNNENGDPEWASLKTELNHFLDEFAQKDAAQLSTLSELSKLQLEFSEFQEKSTRFKREQRRAERRLRSNERQLKALINAHMGAAYLMTAEGQVMAINEMTAELLGKKAQDLVGENIYEYLPERIGKVRKQKTREVVLSGKRLVFQEERDGKIMKNSLYPICDSNGRVVQLAVFSYDITDEQRIIFENKLWTETFHRAPWGVALASSDDWRILTANPAFSKLFLADREEISKLTLIDLTAGIPKKEMDKLFRSALEEKKGVLVLQQRRRDGTCFDALFSIAFVKGEAKACGHFIINIQDISHQKSLEKNLFESEQMLRLVLDHIPSRVYWKDKKLNYLGCNLRYAQDAGLTDPLEIIGQSDEELVWREYKDVYKQDDNTIIEKDTPRINVEESVLFPSGTRGWLRSTKIPLKNQNGETFGVLGMYDDITKQRRVQRQLKESEERYRTLITDISEGFFMTSLRGDLTFANHSLATIMGYKTEKEIVGRSFFEFVVPEARDHIRQLYHSSVQTGEGNRRLQVVIERPDGNRRILDVRPVLIRSKGEVLGTRGVISDITEQQQIEAALRESEEQYRTLFERMNEGFGYHVAEYDDNGDPVDFRYLTINRAYEEHTGLSESKVVGKLISEVFPNIHVTSTPLLQKFGRIAKSGGEERFETYFEPLQKWFSISVFSPKVDHFCTILEDITRRKNLEADREEQQQRLTQLTENIREVFWLTDWERQQVIYISPAYERIWGRPVQNVYEQSTSWFDSIHEEEKEAVQAAWEKADMGGYDVEYRIIRTDGETRWVRDRGFPVKNSAGVVKRIAGLAEDISDEKASRESMTKLNADLQRSNSDLEQFAYVASHDLQEPLRKIQAFGDRLLTSYSEELSDRPLDYLERMVKAAGRMHRLVEDLLAFSRLTTRARPFKSVDLEKVVGDVLDDLSLLIRETGAEIKTSGLPNVIGDATQLHQLFQNLIHNSIKFRVKERPIIVTIDSGWNQEGLYVIIKDNGIGFDNKFSERVFKIFQRLHTQMEYEGTGIGLAMCKKIMEQHNGKITGNGKAGVGSEFLIQFGISTNREVDDD